MKDADLIHFAMEFRLGVLDEKSSDMMCWAIAAPLSALLKCSGVENELVESDTGDRNHFWLRLSDGRVLDPTADQFNENEFGFVLKMPPVYLGPPVQGLHSKGSGLQHPLAGP